jgi:pSer/pThr/pTyr-binding forkhead associated (FHA) protein
MQLGLAFVSGHRAGTLVPLANHAVVGADSYSDLVLAEPGVDSRHAQLYEAGGGYQLLDLRSTGGTFVNGLRVPPGKAVSLVPGSLLRFGEGGPVALFEQTALLQQQPLQLVRESSGETYPLEGPLVLGRSRSCDILLHPDHDAVASSRHLHVLPAFGRAIVTDLGSANGTFFSGRRITQAVLCLGDRIQLGGEGGPWFRIDTMTAAVPAPLVELESASDAAPLPPGPAAPDPTQPAPIPETFSIFAFAGEARARIQVACKPQVAFGSFAGLCDFEVTTFPRELEDDNDAAQRADTIAPQHGAFELTPEGVDLVDGGEQWTKLNGSPLPSSARTALPDAFSIWVGADVVGLRGRLLKHPRLEPTAPRIGMEHQHPVECLVMERAGDGDVESRLYLLLVRQATIGSADEAAIRVPYPGVAPIHASLFLQQDALWITQTGEMPVAVDGVPLSPGTGMPLRVGSEVFLGTTRFLVSE